MTISSRHIDGPSKVAFLVTISPDNVNAINARLAAGGYQGPPITTGVYPNTIDTANFLAKVDHEFNEKDRFTVRYSLYDVHARNSRNVGALNAPSASAGLDNIDQTVAFSNIAILSARTVNETRAQFAYSDLKAPPSDPVGPAVKTRKAGFFPGSSGAPRRRKTLRKKRLLASIATLPAASGDT